MKKKSFDWHGRLKSRGFSFFGKFCLCAVFALIAALPLPAQTYKQQPVSLDVENVSAMDLFMIIQKQTGYSFVFDPKYSDKLGRITLKTKEEPLNKVLDKILKNKGLSYVVTRNVISIIPVDEAGKQISRRKMIKGKVKDKKGVALAGCTVRVKGGFEGAATDISGNFSFDLSFQGDVVLEFTFIGYKKREIRITAETLFPLVVTLEEEVSELDESIVVAYGNTTRRKATGAISVVKAEELKDIPAVSIEGLLQGRVAGMDITQVSGAPGGGGAAVTIRGYNSLDVEQGRRFSNPLWVVDGVPMYSFVSPVTGTNMLADLNPDMIESVQVLKDASSAALYGSRAANGVIVVTTKKGKKNQKATFSSNVSYTYSFLPELPAVTTGRAERLFRLYQAKNNFKAYYDPKTNSMKYPESLREQYDNHRGGARFDGNFDPDPGFNQSNGSIFQDSLNSFYNNSTNFFPIYYVKGKVTNANVQAYGGGERMSYGIGVGFYREEGIFRGTGFDRVDINSSLNVEPVDKLKADMRINVSLSNRKRGSKADLLSTALPPADIVPGEPNTLSSLLPGEGSSVWNKVVENYNGIKEKNRSIRIRSIFKLEYEIMEGLRFSSSLAADYAIERRNTFFPSYLDDRKHSNTIGETGINLMALNENLISYTRTFNEGHYVDILAGCSYQYDQIEYNGGIAKNAPSDKIWYAPQGMPDYMVEESYGFKQIIPFKNYLSDMQEKVLASWFARLEYNYCQKYLLSLSFRSDGSSTFGKNNRWGNFPTVAAAWTFSEEPFVQALPWLNFGKFRASWGKSGKHFESNYLALGIMKVGTSSYLGNPTIEPVWYDGLYNPGLTWEATYQYDFGLDMDFLAHRLSITADYYYRYTDKLLAQIRLSGSHNNYFCQWRNTAAISNEGLEVLIKYEIFRRPELYWKLSVNGARNWNRFEKSYDGKDFDGRIIGKSLNGIYGYKTEGYFNSQDEVPFYFNQRERKMYLHISNVDTYPLSKGDYNIVDVDGDGKISSKDMVYVGSSLPKISGGIVNEIRWKNFDMNLSMAYQIGRHMVNPIVKRAIRKDAASMTGRYIALTFNINDISFWRNRGDNTKYPRLQENNRIHFMNVDRDVEKVNWLKLKTLTIGYSLPKHVTNKICINQLRFFVSGENLFTWTDFSGMDPELTGLTGGFNGDVYPLPRKYTVGLTLKL